MVERPQPVQSSRNQTRITPGAVVCSECELCGEVTIGANTIIHPKARILAEAGPIQIGAFNLIEEQVEIVNRIPESVLKIGDHNVFEGRRRVASERPPAQTLQLDFLTKILPNYHHLLRASRTSTVSSAFASPKAVPK
ncbi:Dynactin subunit 6 [Fasciola gigantica]|uniref:Dynactin subunit 6 n=1 Tax=Fasciola gigantica TaxID=46835 RepID=A0A504Z280_FASGI|nr:Dynactin subunit 6 [Fasciola gigantica]